MELFHSIMWGIGALLVLAVFLAGTEMIESWMRDEGDEPDERSRP